MAIPIITVPSAANLRRVSVHGGNLCQIALQYLGDALQWSNIAALNGLTDPILPANLPFSLLIPSTDAVLDENGFVTDGFGLVSPPINTELPQISPGPGGFIQGEDGISVILDEMGNPISLETATAAFASLGSQINVSTGSWTTSTSSPVAFTDTVYSYQWNLNGIAVIGATGPTYIVQNTDLGQPITATVNAVNRGGVGSATSLPVIAVTGPVIGTELLLTLDFSQSTWPFGA
jgi:hypothetical protein